MADSFGSKGTLRVGDREYTIHRLRPVEKAHPHAAQLPYSLKILLENLLRTEDGLAVRRADIEGLANWQAKEEPSREIAFTPSRVLLQDFTGVPAVVDLAAMRDAMVRMGGDPKQHQSAAPGRAGHRPLGAGRRFRYGALLSHQCRPGIRAQPRALRLPALGPESVRQFRRGAARHRHRSSGQPGVPGPGRPHQPVHAAAGRVSRYRSSAPIRTRR